MAYKEQELKIYPGGLSLVPPGDQVAEGACLDLTDWWPGCAGRLEQAPNRIAISSGAGVASDTLLQSNGRIYYGGGGQLSQIGRNVIDSGYDGYPIGVTSFNGYAWFMNRSKQRRDDGTTCSDWWIGNADQGLTLTDIPGGGALSPNTPYQEYEYYITWVVAGLGETNPGPVAPLTVNQGDAVLIARPNSGDAPVGCTGWNIYRQDYIDTDGVPLFGTVYLLNAAPIPLDQATYTDYGDAPHQQDATSLLELGVIMEMNHDAPPPARVTGNQVFNGRIVVASSADHPNRVWYTNALQPAYFPGADDPNMGNWVDIGTDSGDAIIAIAVRPKTLIIYRQRSIWRQLGDFDDPNARIEPIVPELGIAGPRAMCSTSLGDYFMASAGRGLYYFNNDTAQNVSDGFVDPIFRGQQTENLRQFGSAYEADIAVGYRGGRVWISYPGIESGMIQSLIYHVPSARWFAGSYSYGAFYDTGEQFIGCGGDRQYVWALESTYEAIFSNLSFQSQYYTGGLPDREKTWADLVISHNTQGRLLTVTIRVNKNSSATILNLNNDPALCSFVVAYLVSTSMTKQIIPLVYPGNFETVALRGQPIQSYSLSVRIAGAGADDAPVLIDGPIIVHYYVEARRAMTFDTAPGDQGTPLVKIVDQVEWSIDASDSEGWMQLYSDLPGGVLVPRLSPVLVIPQTVGRQAQRLVLPNKIAGKLLRATAATSTDFRIYGARARVLPIGVYIDGTIGDFWEPVPISIGV